MVNLCLVVIATQFSETKKRETERMWAERQHSSSSATLASIEHLGSCYDEIIGYVAHLGRVARRRFLAIWRRYFGRQRRRRRRRRQEIKGGAEFDVVEGVRQDVHNNDDDHVTSPRRLRFDDQRTSGAPRCHRDGVRMNGCPKITTIEEQTTTKSINGQWTSSDSGANTTDKIDGNESKCFCSGTNSSADRGITQVQHTSKICNWCVSLLRSDGIWLERYVFIIYLCRG